MAEEKKVTKKEKKEDYSKLNLQDSRSELQKLVIKVRTGEETNTSKVKKLKKHIARLLTIQNEAN